MQLKQRRVRGPQPLALGRLCLALDQDLVGRSLDFLDALHIGSNFCVLLDPRVRGPALNQRPILAFRISIISSSSSVMLAPMWPTSLGCFFRYSAMRSSAMNTTLDTLGLFPQHKRLHRESDLHVQEAKEAAKQPDRIARFANGLVVGGSPYFCLQSCTVLWRTYPPSGSSCTTAAG